MSLHVLGNVEVRLGTLPNPRNHIGSVLDHGQARNYQVGSESSCIALSDLVREGMIMCRPLQELEAYRTARRLSRKDLADKMGVTETTIWRWEVGARRPAREYVSELSKLTGVSAATLMGVTE